MRSATIAATGLSDGLVYKFPFQGEIVLSSMNKVASGKLTLSLSVEGDPGIHTGLRGEKFTKFEGKLLSNTMQFEVGGK